MQDLKFDKSLHISVPSCPPETPPPKHTQRLSRRIALSLLQAMSMMNVDFEDIDARLSVRAGWARDVFLRLLDGKPNLNELDNITDFAVAMGVDLIFDFSRK